MTFVQFKGYGRSNEKFVNIERIISFEQISSNGDHGTEIKMDDGTAIRVGHWPIDVSKMITFANQKEGEA